MLGSDFIVAPVMEPDQDVIEVYIPKTAGKSDNCSFRPTHFGIYVLSRSMHLLLIAIYLVCVHLLLVVSLYKMF